MGKDQARRADRRHLDRSEQGGRGEVLGAAGKTEGDEPEQLDDEALYGRGEKDPVTGLYEWYEYPAGWDLGLTWAKILTLWPLVEQDLHQVYGIDVEEPGLLRARSWRWLSTRILGLLTVESSRLRTVLIPRKEPPRR